MDRPLRQWLTRRKKRGRQIQKFEYLENKKSFLDEIKSIFHSFWRATIWLKKKHLMKIADTSFNRQSCSKNEPNIKLNHIFIVQISFCARNAIKNETNNVNTNSFICSIFVILLIFTPPELRKWYGDPLFLNLIFKYFPKINNSGKFKEVSSTSFYCIILT